MATAKTISIHIERLDEGFVLTEDGRRKAIATSNIVLDTLSNYFEGLVRRSVNPECNTCEIFISFTENPNELESA